MLEKYPYNEDFEAWEVKTKLLDEEITVLTQARDEMEFIKRTVELHERIKWLNDKGQDICDLLSSNEKDLTVDGESRIELRPAEIAVLRCYAERRLYGRTSEKVLSSLPGQRSAPDVRVLCQMRRF